MHYHHPNLPKQLSQQVPIVLMPESLVGVSRHTTITEYENILKSITVTLNITKKMSLYTSTCIIIVEGI